MDFKRLNANYTESCFECRLRALKNNPTSFLSTFEEESIKGMAPFQSILAADKDDNVIFGALVKNNVVGMAGIYVPQRTKQKHRATIWGMYVDPEFRGKGAGRKLVEMCISHAKMQILSAVYLSVETHNFTAKALYQSMGFQIWGTEPRAMSVARQFFDEDHMTLIL